MNQPTIDLIKDLFKTILPLAAALAGALIAGKYSKDNMLKSLKIQGEQRDQEWKRDQAAKEHKELQEWFYTYAIEKCVDPLLCEIVTLLNLISARALNADTKIDANATPPELVTEASMRLFLITGAYRLGGLASMVRKIVGSNSFPTNEMQNCLQQIFLSLVRLKQNLLETEINKKSDLSSLCTIPSLQKIGDGIDRIIFEMLTSLSPSTTATDPVTDLTKYLRDFAKYPPKSTPDASKP